MSDTAESKNESPAIAGWRSTGAGRSGGGLVARLLGRVVFPALARMLPAAGSGSVAVTIPDVGTRRFGDDRAGPQAAITFHSPSVLWRALARGPLGFAESYLRGEWDTPDLKTLFDYFLDNEASFHAAGKGRFRVRGRDRRQHAARANTREGSRRNIAAHYDLGNEFYTHWLDAGMTYSSAIHAGAPESLETAQDRKYQRVHELAGVKPGDRVLEIGCGWGGYAERAARLGASIVGVTLSERQLAHARARMDAAGLASNADLRLQDYRDIEGTFDAIVSIEMIEAVGEENWPHYFQVLHDRLRPGGHAVLQAITIPERFYASYRRTPDFIQRYIFPGGMLPSVAAIEAQARAAGLVPTYREHFAKSYATTLEAWLSRFRQAWPEIERLGFDQRFRRMWEYYLVYCVVGFERGLIDVGLYRLTRPHVAL